MHEGIQATSDAWMPSPFLDFMTLEASLANVLRELTRCANGDGRALGNIGTAGGGEKNRPHALPARLLDPGLIRLRQAYQNLPHMANSANPELHQFHEQPLQLWDLTGGIHLNSAVLHPGCPSYPSSPVSPQTSCNEIFVPANGLEHSKRQRAATRLSFQTPTLKP